eukprot:SAG31_NODE_16191_length_719_cov_1.174194_2_plen_165_part_00
MEYHSDKCIPRQRELLTQATVSTLRRQAQAAGMESIEEIDDSQDPKGALVSFLIDTLGKECERNFTAIARAKEVLSNETERWRYDQGLDADSTTRHKINLVCQCFADTRRTTSWGDAVLHKNDGVLSCGFKAMVVLAAIPRTVFTLVVGSCFIWRSYSHVLALQ